MSYVAATTSNNLTENLGMLAGLNACVQHHWAPMHIVRNTSAVCTGCMSGSLLHSRSSAGATIGVTTTRQPML
ncbi:hypothetical protein PI125_g22670 [Phytophthora idaei]|nr:hypothetical protein PI125_g22670 [Phytophthora idaei]KAG3129664.1 hypothetical protein PI126_g20859 [Phytophthora idaei]